MPVPCPGCGWLHDGAGSLATQTGLHALADDDLDRAIEAGLLPPIRCDGCAPECQARLHAARAQRLDALAARERHRARADRLQMRAQERLQKHAARHGATSATARLETKPPLPSA